MHNSNALSAGTPGGSALFCLYLLVGRGQLWYHIRRADYDTGRLARFALFASQKNRKRCHIPQMLRIYDIISATKEENSMILRRDCGHAALD